MADRLADFRSVFAKAVMARAGVDDARVEAAFAQVPRERFAGRPPWTFREDGYPVSTQDPAVLYQDVGLGIGPGIPSGLPSLHAACLAARPPAPGARVLHVGAGLGYYTAILAQLVGEAGYVVAAEIEPSLATAARDNLEPWPTAETQCADGSQFSVSVFDYIYVWV